MMINLDGEPYFSLAWFSMGIVGAIIHRAVFGPQEVWILFVITMMGPIYIGLWLFAGLLKIAGKVI